MSFAGKDIKVISLTSCTPSEGKSSVSFQLCLSLAESGKKTILVDADLRKSVLRGRYKASREKYGLSHYLSGQAEYDDVCCRTNGSAKPKRAAWKRRFPESAGIASLEV